MTSPEFRSDGSGMPQGAADPAPVRLTVGVVSAGRVGTALGEALERVGHLVVACSAVSELSRERARTRLPDSLILPVHDVASRAELLILAVPDVELRSIAAGLAATISCRCSPSPSMPSVTTSPTLRYCGGFMPVPTTGGVPVVMISPGISVMNCET